MKLFAIEQTRTLFIPITVEQSHHKVIKANRWARDEWMVAILNQEGIKCENGPSYGYIAIYGIRRSVCGFVFLAPRLVNVLGTALSYSGIIE
ncbi:hypothetical protein BOO93_07415 [Vibrio navarrensis]|nr:hypothetical protein [Vibrio navarrensis]